MALVPRIRRMPHSELQIHSLDNFLNYSASAPENLVSCCVSSYLRRSDSEDTYV